MLVQRHGPLVLGTCRRLLRDTHAAEDAFQATFLVLARRAAALERQGSLAGWLYGVAYRIAVRARANAARRYSREVSMDSCNDVCDPAGDDVAGRTSQQELRAVLDEEMQRLPVKYRAPLILCYLQGKTNEQAARELGRPPGSMSRHLTRARELLQERLTGRGMAVGAVLLGPQMPEATATTLPAALTARLVQAALHVAAGQSIADVVSAQTASLTQGALQAMWMTRLKVVVLFLLTVSVAAIGTGALLYSDAGKQLPANPSASAEGNPAIGEAAAAKYEPPTIPPQWTSISLRHDEAVRVFALSPDGRLVATESSKAVCLWETGTGKQVRRHASERYL
jgi:RNA polymerase sigma factor (sigma-70 family)